MEFKYRAGASTSRPQPVCPHSSGVGFFSDQAWRVDLPGTRNLRPYLNSEFDAMRDSYLVRETIQREIEKQKIREDIIASEVVRRQMLEDEVRREMMLERQMVLWRAGEGLPFEGKSAMWFGFNQGHPALHWLESRGMEDHLAYVGRNAVDVSSLPLIRSPEATPTEIKPELNKDRLIMLPRPDPNLLRAKRKASTSSADAGELSTFSRKKKTKEEWTCALCQVSATSEKGLKEHLEGKKHKIKEASLAQKIGKEGNTDSQVSQELKKHKIKEASLAQKIGKEGNTDSQVSQELKKHKIKEASLAQKIGKEGNTESQVSQELKKHKIKEASLAQKIGKEGNTELQVNQELKHSMKLRRLKMVQKLENIEGLRKNKNFQFWCEMCQIGAFSKTVMESHKNGRKHIARLRELGQAEETGCAAVSRASANSDTEQNVATDVLACGGRS